MQTGVESRVYGVAPLRGYREAMEEVPLPGAFHGFTLFKNAAAPASG